MAQMGLFCKQGFITIVGEMRQHMPENNRLRTLVLALDNPFSLDRRIPQSTVQNFGFCSQKEILQSLLAEEVVVFMSLCRCKEFQSFVCASLSFATKDLNSFL